MTDNSRTAAAALAGAAIGAIVGYLFFTNPGRTLRRRIEPALDDIARELNSFRSTVRKASGVANEGWHLLNDALGEDGQRNPRFAGTHQSSPF